MLEKRKRRVRMIILSVLCAALAGVSVTEGILYLQMRRDYMNLQSQQTEVEKEYEDASSQLKEKTEKIDKLENLLLSSFFLFLKDHFELFYPLLKKYFLLVHP